MGRRKRETRGTTLMVCAGLVVGCMAPYGGGIACAKPLAAAGVPSFPWTYAHTAEASCDGETQLWIDAQRPEPAGAAAPDAEEAPAGVEPPAEGKAPGDSALPTEGDAPGAKAERGAPSASDQLRQSISVPVTQGHALPLTADTLTSAKGVGALALGAALALGVGVRTRGGVQV